MTTNKALELFQGRDVPQHLAESNAAKLINALHYLGDRYILAKPVKRLKLKKRSY